MCAKIKLAVEGAELAGVHRSGQVSHSTSSYASQILSSYAVNAKDRIDANKRRRPVTYSI